GAIRAAVRLVALKDAVICFRCARSGDDEVCDASARCGEYVRDARPIREGRRKWALKETRRRCGKDLRRVVWIDENLEDGESGQIRSFERPRSRRPARIRPLDPYAKVRVGTAVGFTGADIYQVRGRRDAEAHRNGADSEGVCFDRPTDQRG